MNAPIHTTAGTIFVAGEPVSFTEALILRDVVTEEFLGARAQHDRPSMAELSERENVLRCAIHQAAEYRRAAGWSDPAAADRRPSF